MPIGVGVGSFRLLVPEGCGIALNRNRDLHLIRVVKREVNTYLVCSASVVTCSNLIERPSPNLKLKWLGKRITSSDLRMVSSTKP